MQEIYLHEHGKCVGSSQDTRDSVICLENSHDSTCKSSSWLGFVKVKKHKVRLAKGKGTWAACKLPGARFQESSLSRTTKDTFHSSRNDMWQVWNVKQESLLETLSKVVIEGLTDHIGTLCTASTETSDYQKEHRCSTYTILFALRE
jgi:hypothetical protein